MRTYDSIVVGGGPAGSTCARVLAKAGRDVLVLDAAKFPRLKLCAGWVSPHVWDVVDLPAAEYQRGIWPWDRLFISFRGRTYTVPSKGYWIRRYEWDEVLLGRTGATVVTGHRVRQVSREPDGSFVLDGEYRTKHLIGAGGTNCPIARALFERTGWPVTTQEIEFEAGTEQVAAGRLGRDGECEIVLHDDIGGYSWAVPKTAWFNVGSGTFRPRDVLPAWDRARGYFEASGRIPPGARAPLDHVKGHSYYLFQPERLSACHRDGVSIIGDAVGLAHPLTGEGILPAVLSGKHCAEAILAGDPASYPDRLAREPALRDYPLYYRLSHLLAPAARDAARGGEIPPRAATLTPTRLPRAFDPLLARAFGFAFSGKPVRGSRAISAVVGVIEKFDRA